MKKIELTAEWILDNLTISKTCKDNLVTIEVDFENDRTAMMFVDLAFKTLGITPNQFDIENGIEGSDNNWFTAGYEFELDELKEDCPNLYKSLLKINENNKNYPKE